MKQDNTVITENLSEWYKKTEKQIGLHKDTLNKKDHKKYKLDLLLRIARRLENFSNICSECQTFKQDLTKLLQDLSYSLQVSNTIQMSKEEHKSYNYTINNIIKHLKKQHNLISEGYYTGISTGIGTAVGVGLGAAFENTGAGIGLGAAIGTGIGIYLERKAKKEDRII